MPPPNNYPRHRHTCTAMAMAALAAATAAAPRASHRRCGRHAGGVSKLLLGLLLAVVVGRAHGFLLPSPWRRSPLLTGGKPRPAARGPAVSWRPGVRPSWRIERGGGGGDEGGGGAGQVGGTGRDSVPKRKRRTSGQGQGREGPVSSEVRPDDSPGGAFSVPGCLGRWAVEWQGGGWWATVLRCSLARRCSHPWMRAGV